MFNARIATCSQRLAEEEARPLPDTALIEVIEWEQLEIALERSNLKLTHLAEVAAVIRWSRVALAQQEERYWPSR